MSRRHRSRAAGVVRGVLRELLPDAEVVGRASFVGEGVTYRTWALHCVHEGVDTELVVRLPRRRVDAAQPARARREAALLARVAVLGLPFAVPRVLGLVEVPEGLAMVQTRCSGGPLSGLLPDALEGLRWTMPAFAAAALHRVDPTRLSDLVSGPATRAEHVREDLAALRGVGHAVLDEAADWIEAHLPPPTSSCVLHLDLLPQNLLVAWLDEGPLETHLSVIDWEQAELGDPALDLAVLTGGARRPLGRPDGLDRLLEAYHAYGGQPVTRAQVHVQELAMFGRGAVGALASTDGAQEGEVYVNRLRGLLRRVRDA